MRLLRNISMAVFICTIVAAYPLHVRAIGCDSNPATVGTTPDWGSDPGNFYCDYMLNGFCESCGCDYGVRDQGCEFGEAFYEDGAYWVNGFAMHCECEPNMD